MANAAWMVALALAVTPAPDSVGVWHSLAGHWAGSGEVRGMQAEVELRFRPAFGARGWHLDFSNRMRDAEGGTWRFQAEALYLCDPAATCRGHWYDSRGTVLPLTARAGADRLVVEWGDAQTERGRTTYALQGDGGLHVIDEVREEAGTWRRFGQATMRRMTAGH